MNTPQVFKRLASPIIRSTRPKTLSSRLRRPQVTPHRSQHGPQKPRYENPADDPSWTSVIDAPPVLVRMKKRSKTGALILALIPITAFALGTWQIYRLKWKTDMIARFEDRLIRDPLPLPPTIDPAAVGDFDYRRVTATGRFRHDQEMLVGPRMRESKEGYIVMTPLEREGGSTILVYRGWIPKNKSSQQSRPLGLPQGEVVVEGLLREPFKKNMFTPDNNIEKGEFYFPDVKQMAELTGSTPVWIEETMTPDLLTAYDRESKGVPIGRPAEVLLRNNHTQYIFTWYTLSAATTVMLYMLLKKAPSSTAVRKSNSW